MTIYRYLMILMTAVALHAGFTAQTIAQENGDVVVNPESGEAYRAGLELFNNSRFQEAADEFEKAYSLDSRNINALFAHGYALTRLGRYSDAADILAKVLEQDPSYEKALRLLPVALTNAGRNDSALAAFDNGIEKLPGNYQLIYGKAVLLLKMERNQDAIPLLVEASRLQPGSVEILEKLAYAYRESGDTAHAYETAQIIVGKNADNGNAQAIIGDYHRMRAEYDEALAAYAIAARNIETKAYAEHYIQVINQTLEEIEIEKEFEERMQSGAQ